LFTLTAAKLLDHIGGYLPTNLLVFAPKLYTCAVFTDGIITHKWKEVIFKVVACHIPCRNNCRNTAVKLTMLSVI